jgi:hypothetical protein
VLRCGRLESLRGNRMILDGAKVLLAKASARAVFAHRHHAPVCFPQENPFYPATPEVCCSLLFHTDINTAYLCYLLFETPRRIECGLRNFLHMHCATVVQVRHGWSASKSRRMTCRGNRKIPDFGRSRSTLHRRSVMNFSVS